jgi:ABC-type sugar transport system ATPase subunit
VSLGIAYLPENRQSDGLFYNLGVRENISFMRLENFTWGGIISTRLEAKEAGDLAAKLNIHTPNLEERIANLSGGNQQKVILARCLSIKPRILIADEPTKGIDVGSKQEIYLLLNRLARDGVAVLFISSEMPEILGLSDRILVMHEGRLAGTLSRAEASEEKIMLLATGQSVDQSIL